MSDQFYSIAPVFRASKPKKRNYKQDPSFFNSVSASWLLEPFGQLYLDEDTFLDKPYDPPKNIDEQIIGYERYRDHFADIRNQDHLDYMKEKIDYNNHLRTIRDEGGMIPEIIAAFGDPLTYAPFPLVKGFGLTKRFAKGFGISAGLTASMEPVRHAYDPTATKAESAMYIGAAGLLGGGLITYFGRRAPVEVGHGKSQTEKAESILKETHNTETNDFNSNLYDKDNPESYDIDIKSYDVEGVDNVIGKGEYDLEETFEGLLPGEVVKIITKGTVWRGKVLARDLIIIDEHGLQTKFNDGSYQIPDVEGAGKIPELESAEDYKKFLIKKYHIKDKGGAPEGKDAIDEENLLNLEVKTEMLKAKIGRQTAGKDEGRSWFAERTDRWITDMGSLLNNKVKNEKLNSSVADFAMRMFGDSATTNRAAKAGYSVPQSALIKATANHFKTVGGFHEQIHKVFQKYRGRISKVSDPKLGYQFGSIGIRFKDAKDKALSKLGILDDDEIADGGMTFGEFNSFIYRTIIDEDLYKTAPKEIQEFADQVRNIYKIIGEEAESLGMFQTQGSVRKLREQWEGLTVDAKIHLNKYKTENPKDKAGIEEFQKQYNRARQHERELLIQEKNITEGLEQDFSPLVENYVNRVYDIDKIQDEILNEIWEEAALTALQKNHIPFDAPAGFSKTMNVVGNYNELKKLAEKKGYKVVTKSKGKNRAGKPIASTVDHRAKILYIDVKHIKEVMWPEKAHLNPKVKGVKPINKKLIKNENDLVEFIMAHEVNHIFYRRDKSGKKTLAEYENYINEKATLSVLANKTNGNINQKYFTVPKSNGFRGMLYENFKGNKHDDIDIYMTNVEVDNAINNITRDSTNLNMDNDIVFTNGVARSSAFQSRNIDIDDKILAPYLIQDISYLVRMYSERMHKRIEMTKQFGDPTADAAIWKQRQDLLNGEYKENGNLQEINEIYNRLTDARDKYYGLFNTADPDSFFKSRLPATLRNWASTAMMGKVLFASIVDFGRIPMVHGVHNTFRYLNSKHPLAADNKEFNEQISQNAWLGDAYDVVMNNASARFIGQTDYRVGRGNTAFSRFFDRKIGQTLEDIQAPFYHMNLLSGWTQLMKEMTQHISTHRFLEDSKKVANGTATKFEIARLADYGISLQEARAIGRMPMYRTNNGMMYTKKDEWYATKNGEYLGNKLRYATFADVQRTIITPSIADKPNMMFGVIRIQNENLARQFDNDVFRFLGGFEKTEYGGKFNNGFLALPFQFYAWSFAANRRLMLSGLAGRDMDLASGIIGMVLLASLGDYLKNPLYYQHKTTEEKIYRAIEMSGILGLPADVNFALETISDGLFDTPLGVRPSLGIPPRFGEANVSDGLGEFVGPGPSNILEFIRSLGSDVGLDEKAQIYRRLIPFNNVIYLDGLFKKITRGVTEIIR